MQNIRPITMVYLLLELQPFEHGIVILVIYSCLVCNLKTVEIFSQNFTEMLSTMRQCAENKNHNWFTFGFMAL